MNSSSTVSDELFTVASFGETSMVLLGSTRKSSLY